MMEIIEFLFADFWHWLGGLIYIAVITSIFSEALSYVASLFRRPDKS